MVMDKLIFGDNQFLGVNHADQSLATTLSQKYSEPTAIIDTLGCAYDNGIRTFMFTSHDRYDLVFSEIIRENYFPEMKFAPCVPYAHKYWDKLVDGGIVNLMRNTVGQLRFLELAKVLLDFPAGNFQRAIELLIKIETLQCQGLNVQSVFIQNLAFDYLIAIERYDLIEDFYKSVYDRLEAIPGFITMNHPRSVDVLTNTIGIQKPLLCSNFNLSGFRMHPAPEKVVNSFAQNNSYNIAMNVFSQQDNPQESYDFVIDKMVSGSVDSILFGSSSSTNISRNIRHFNSRINAS